MDGTAKRWGLVWIVFPRQPDPARAISGCVAVPGFRLLLEFGRAAGRYLAI